MHFWVQFLLWDVIYFKWKKDFYDDELIEVAVTRIDGNNVNGFGQIGTLGFTIQDDIIRGTDSIFSFEVFNIIPA